MVSRSICSMASGSAAGVPLTGTMTLGLATSLLFFLSVILHELRHSVIALRNGIPVRSITLFIFGGVAQIGREPGSPGVEFRVAIAGPIVSFALAAVLVVAGFMFGPSAEPGRVEPVSSISLAVFLFGATALVLGNNHADAAMVVFALLVAATFAIAWRAESATGAIVAAALFVFAVFAEWAIRANPELTVMPGGAMPTIAFASSKASGWPIWNGGA